MLKHLIRRRIDAFGRKYDYDTSYLREILETDMRAALMMGQLSTFARYRKDVPREVWYAAKITAAMKEDCGPCTQLVVSMAEQEGVDLDILRALVARNLEAMPSAVALATRFTEAVLRHDLAADELRDQILARWGRGGLVSITFAITAARLFPTVKYALGHGQACSRVTIGGAAQPALGRAA